MVASLKKPKLLHKFAKERDLEVHLRQYRVLGVEFLELRDFVPSRKRYGRGFTFESRHLPRLIEVLSDHQRYVGVDTAAAAKAATADQGSLFA